MIFKKDETVTDAEEMLYEQVAQEISSGNIRQGLWLKAFADAEGDELKAKAAYSRMRVAQLAKDLRHAMEEEAKKAQSDIASSIDKFQHDLKASNCALGESPSGGYILYTSDGACTHFANLALLQRHFYEKYRHGH